MVDCSDLFSGSWVTFGAQISDEVGPLTLFTCLRNRIVFSEKKTDLYISYSLDHYSKQPSYFMKNNVFRNERVHLTFKTSVLDWIERI